MKRFFVILLAVVLCGGMVQGQKGGRARTAIDPKMKLTVSPVAQNLFESALKCCLVVLQRDYQLEDTGGVRYGWKGAPEFSRVYSLGVCTEGGIIATTDFVKPWENDVNFTNFRNTQYKPVATRATYRPDMEMVDREPFPGFDDQKVDSIQEGLYRLPIPPLLKAFPVDSTEGVKEGFLVLLLADGKLDSGVVKAPAYHFMKMELTADVKRPYHAVNIDSLKLNKQVLGGIFVRPQIGLGTIAMRIVGVLQQREGAWMIATPFVERPAIRLNTEGLFNYGGITPVEKNKTIPSGLIPTPNDTNDTEKEKTEDK